MTSPRGPQPGSTPPDSDELSDNSSPWHTGEHLGNVAKVGSSTYPLLSTSAGAPNPSVAGYFFNPPADGMNPYHDANGIYTVAEQAARSEIADGMAAALERNLGYGIPIGGADPNTDVDAHRFYIDNGENDRIIPPAERR